MGNRRTRNTAISVAIEGSYGSSPGTFSPVLLTGVPNFQIDPDVVDRNNVRGYFGASEQLVGTRRAVMEFQTELSGSSALGTPPEWGKLLRACGFAETITASTRVEYTPITASPESLTFRFNRDGVRYTSRGARGTVSFGLDAYDRPVLNWRFWGFDTAAITDPIGTPNLSAWQRPLVITDANSAVFKLGSSYSAGNITGGTQYPHRGLSLDVNNTLSHMKLTMGESIDITNREMNGQVELELSETDEVTFRTDINANTVTSASFSIGTAGSMVAMHLPQVQRITPQTIDYQGKLLLQMGLRILPTASGNDEMRVIVK